MAAGGQRAGYWALGQWARFQFSLSEIRMGITA
jgi:hypothetical protein